MLPREEFSEDLLNSSLALADALKLYPELLKNAPPRLTGIDGEASSLLARIQDLSSKLGKDFTPRDSDDLRTMLTLFHDCRKFALRAEAARDRHPNPYEWAPITRVDQEITQKVGARTHLNLDDLESVVQQEEDRARQAAMTPEQHMKFECDHMFDGKKLGNGSYGEAKAAQRACLAHATFDTCCQTPAQQMWYCKAWANDPEHMRDLPPKPISWGRRCPELLACHPCTNNLENFVRGVEVTEQERATARKVIQNEQQKETEEQATREAEHRRQAEIARADYERRKKAYDEQQAKFRAISAGIWKQLNLHKGETQATVKERLREFGFHSTVPNYPGIWVCTEARLKGYNWTNGCAAQDKDGHGITVLFLVAQRYRDPDTGIVSDRRVDRLIAADFDEGVGKIDPELSDLQ